ncbi:hypothetical protein L3Q82_023446 [Scortum barcoo]|uniref:Uncharacterized protein n=1 Tax=Scortum barcoo TaxID=214431 RepID=A0ACB8X0E5_9TELE|nr:hypothetical protein L3Q82_023446 [Scortum barcoo]
MLSAASKRNDKPNSLHWLLKEPLIHGARLDISSSVAPGLTAALCSLLTGVPVVQRWGEVVGYGSVKSASRMNGAVVLIFLDSPEKVSDVVVSGVVIQDSFTPVHPLVNPARKITISNHAVSGLSKSPLLKHVVCHRRQVFMVLRENSAELNLSFNFKVDGFSYMVFATSETMKCFGCGAEGHLIRSCPEGAGGRGAGCCRCRRGGAKLVNPPAESESESLLSQEEQTLYSPADIKKFLQGTKGTRLLKVEDHFSDLKLFIDGLLANLLGVAAEGALVRSRFLNITQMDAPSQFFFWSGEEEWTKKNSSLPCDPATALQSPTLLRSGNLQSKTCWRFLTNCLERGRLPLSCRRAVITLLPKKGDLQELKNWRPVSLLCTDYKIMSKVLASRLREVMASIIHPDQTYCVPGRLISDNVTLIRDILEVSGSLAVDTGLISIDQEKAFDRVEHKYLWQNFSCFWVQRGIRQGCCLSGMLYSLAIEPLLHKLRNKLSGVCVPGCDVSFKLSAYADDVVALFLLLSRIQAVLVDFFWDRLHWVPQSILFLPKEEGGQGLVHLASRGAAFPPSVLTETPHRTCRPGLEAFILLHLAEVWWSETGSGSVPDGLQESGHFISASVLQKCFLSVDFTEEAEEGTGRLSVLALTGTAGIKVHSDHGSDTEALETEADSRTVSSFLLNDFCYGSLQQNCEDPFPSHQTVPGF